MPACDLKILVGAGLYVKKVKKQVDGKEQEVDKKWTYFELSEYHYLSFIEHEKSATRIGAGLRKLGMTAGDRLHIFAATRYASGHTYGARIVANILT